jgi:hypothetical protein
MKSLMMVKTMLVRFLLKGMGNAFWITNPTQHRRTIHACSVMMDFVMTTAIGGVVAVQGQIVLIVARAATTELDGTGTQPHVLCAHALHGVTLPAFRTSTAKVGDSQSYR